MLRLRPALLSSILALATLACSELPVAAAFAPSRPPLASPIIHPSVGSNGKVDATNKLSSDDDIRIRGINPNHRRGSSLSMIPSPLSIDTLHHQYLSSPSSLFLPSILTSFDEVKDREEAFTDQVSFSELTSDPFLQAAFVASAVAIVLLVAAKAVVNQMDKAVEQVALDFDRVMKLKYAKKWDKFMIGKEGEDEADRIQRVVEEMERLTKEEPEFMERVMQDIERMQ
mmetsp:Transcript_5638/g.12282  ORF Transcript_5638/g.12282 Transcript_5638/m.12282 type:complete len:228 (-) Transcript_5638:248-931(-)